MTLTVHVLECSIGGETHLMSVGEDSNLLLKQAAQDLLEVSDYDDNINRLYEDGDYRTLLQYFFDNVYLRSFRPSFTPSQLEDLVSGEHQLTRLLELARKGAESKDDLNFINSIDHG